jgi:hypothetical protein
MQQLLTDMIKREAKIKGGSSHSGSLMQQGYMAEGSTFGMSKIIWDTSTFSRQYIINIGTE